MSLRKLFKKNNDNDSGIRKTGLKRLLDKEGFYIIMFLCVCIVGITAVWVAKSNIDRLAEDEMQDDYEFNIAESEIIDMPEDDIEDQTQDIIIIDEGSEDERDGLGILNEETEQSLTQETLEPNEGLENNKGKVLVEKPDPKPQISITNVPKTEDESGAVEASNEEAITMIWPTQGELGMGYAVETLTYSKTLEHFTTHHGIDIMAEKNTPVKAVLAGEVIEVLTDSRLGITISIKHEEGLVTRYSNLCTDAMVNTGDKVTQGQTISGVGESSIFESAEDPHLHFEVLINGESVDPMEYLAEE